MKLVNITLSVALLGLISIASVAQGATTVSVDAQIEAIQNAPADKRVELMNLFKQKLMQMNQEDRMAAIKEMQHKMHSQSGDSHDHSKEYDMDKMTQTRTQEHIQEMQTHEHMNQMQDMEQQQAGDQYMQTDWKNGGSEFS